MKNILVLLLLTIFMVGCSKDNDDRIVGVWERVNGSSTFDFRENGKLIVSNSYNFEYTVDKDIIRVRDPEFKKNYTFTYQLDGNTLTMKAQFDAVFGGVFESEYTFKRKI